VRDDLVGSLRLKRFPNRPLLRLMYVVTGCVEHTHFAQFVITVRRYNIMYLFGSELLPDVRDHEQIAADEEIAHA